MNAKEMMARKRAAIDDLKGLVSIYEKFVPRRVFYDEERDSFRYIGRAYDYTSAL